MEEQRSVEHERERGKSRNVVSRKVWLFHGGGRGKVWSINHTLIPHIPLIFSDVGSGGEWGW